MSIKLPFRIHRNLFDDGCDRLNNQHFDFTLNQKFLVHDVNVEIGSIVEKSSSISNYQRNDFKYDADLLEDFKLLLSKTKLKDHVDINLHLHDFLPERNPDDFKSGGRMYSTRGRIGYEFKNVMFRDEAELFGIHLYVGLQERCYLPHEFGHLMDFAISNKMLYYSDEVHDDYDDIYFDFRKKLVSDKSFLIYNLEQQEYFIDQSEVFARFMNTWYQNEVHYPKTGWRTYDIEFKSEPNFAEKIVISYYNDHPEVAEFFNKHFGGIVPVENMKYFDKNKWDDLHGVESSVIDDNDLLTRYNNFILDNNIKFDKGMDNEINYGN